MKNKFCLITAALVAAVCLCSCSLVSDDSIPESACAEFSMSPELAKAIYSKTQADEYNHEMEYKCILRIEVELSGTYTQKKTVDIDITDIDSDKTKGPDEEEKLIIERLAANKIRFEDIPVGSQLNATARIYLIYQKFAYDEEVSKLIIKGTSDTVTIKGGENNIDVKLEYVIKDIPVTVSFNYENSYDSPSSSAQLSYMNIYALKKGSELADMYYNLYKDGFGEDTDFYSLMSVSSSSDCLGYAYVTAYNTHSSMKYNAADNSISGTIELPVGEDAILVGLVYYDDSVSGKTLYYIAHPEGGTLEAARAKSVKTDVNGFNTSLILSKFNIALNTQYVLYQKSGSSYQYYLSSSAETVSGYADFTTTSSNFCFDSNGYFYTLYLDGSDWYIKSNNPVCSSVKSNVTAGECSYPVLFADKDANIMWLSKNNGGSNAVLLKYSNLISSGSAESVSYAFSIPDSTYELNAGAPIIINKGIVYAVIRNSSEGKNHIVKADLSETELRYGESYYPRNDVTELDFSSNSEISSLLSTSTVYIEDLLYQNGAVYLLVKQQVLENTELFYSRGGVIRYDVSTGAVKIIGWTSNPIPFNESKPTYYYAYENGGNQYRTAGGSSYESADKVLIRSDATSNEESEFLKLYSPVSETSGFYGPVKFIAVKPKQLVIADDGVAFYTDSLGAYRLKNVNRVVTVDLETFALTPSAVADEITFGGEYSNGSNFIAPKSSLYADGDVMSFYNATTKAVISTCMYFSSNPENPGETTISTNNNIGVKPGIPTVAE